MPLIAVSVGATCIIVALVVVLVVQRKLNERDRGAVSAAANSEEQADTAAKREQLVLVKKYTRKFELLSVKFREADANGQVQALVDLGLVKSFDVRGGVVRMDHTAWILLGRVPELRERIGRLLVAKTFAETATNQEFLILDSETSEVLASGNVVLGLTINPIRSER